jgi:hypothetical protein
VKRAHGSVDEKLKHEIGLGLNLDTPSGPSGGADQAYLGGRAIGQYPSGQDLGLGLGLESVDPACPDSMEPDCIDERELVN